MVLGAGVLGVVEMWWHPPTLFHCSTERQPGPRGYRMLLSHWFLPVRFRFIKATQYFMSYPVMG